MPLNQALAGVPRSPGKGDRRSVFGIALYVGIALGLSLLHGTVFYLESVGRITSNLPRTLLDVLRSYGPAVAGVAAAWFIGGREGVASLGRRLTRWRIPPGLAAFALAGPLAFMAVAVGVAGVLHPQAMAVGQVNPVRLLGILLVLPFVDGPVGEEIGWRGFLLPALSRRYDAILTSLIVGVVWFLWHLPLYHADGIALTTSYLAQYFVFVVASSFLHTWFYQGTGQSILWSIVLHNMLNYAVVLGSSVFPALSGVPVADVVYSSLVIGAGLCAAIALARSRSPVLYEV